MGAIMTSKPTLILLSFLLLVAFASGQGRGGRGRGRGRGGKGDEGTQVGFYSRSCPRVETIVRAAVEKHFNLNPAIAPGLVRMHFHDCFSHGCDASVLIDGPGAERTAVPNRSLRGFEAIDEAKAQLEAACPGIVSCADILTLAARDSVVLTNGPNWAVPLGRRDGNVSTAAAASNLPGPRDTVEVQKQKLATMNLDTKDLVTLSGAHTIGTTSCNLIRFRLFNFNSTGLPDPTINPLFLPQLQAICPENGDGSVRVALDTDSVGKFDTNYFFNLRNGRAVLQSDQFLWADRTTRFFAQRLFGRGAFNREFAPAMVKMSNTKVLTGTEGEIRRVCSAFN